MLIVRGTAGAIRAVAAIGKAARPRAAVRAAIGAAVAVPIVLAGTQTVLAGTQTAGSGWALQTLPAPAGSFAASMESVSCTSSDSCLAIGGASIRSGDEPFGEVWNGTDWTFQSIPAPANSDLFGVACPSPAGCTAVGRVLSDGDQIATPLAENWNGTSWTPQTLPPPPGSVSGTLAGVSCTSPVRCVAVGYSDRPDAFSENWNGTTWTPHSAPLPPDGVSAEFLGVSCRSYRSCIAVGTGADLLGIRPAGRVLGRPPLDRSDNPGSERRQRRHPA